MRLQLDRLHIDTRRADWMRRLAKELELELGDPHLAEQAAQTLGNHIKQLTGQQLSRPPRRRA
jgi:hypothetical protein